MPRIRLLASILVVLPISYEYLAIVSGPIIAEIATGVVGEILYMQVVFNAGGFVAPRPGR